MDQTGINNNNNNNSNNNNNNNRCRRQPTTIHPKDIWLREKMRLRCDEKKKKTKRINYDECGDFIACKNAWI